MALFFVSNLYQRFFNLPLKRVNVWSHLPNKMTLISL